MTPDKESLKTWVAELRLALANETIGKVEVQRRVDELAKVIESLYIPNYLPSEKLDVGAVVRLQVMVEIEAPGTYGASWTLEDMLKQAGREALERLRSLIKGEAKILGEPKVTAVLAQRS